jgi:hypothetical protein
MPIRQLYKITQLLVRPVKPRKIAMVFVAKTSGGYLLHEMGVLWYINGRNQIDLLRV